MVAMFFACTAGDENRTRNVSLGTNSDQRALWQAAWLVRGADTAHGHGYP